MADLVVALGLVLVLEGLLYGGFPEATKRLAADISMVSERLLRISGVAAIAVGVLLVWLIKG